MSGRTDEIRLLTARLRRLSPIPLILSASRYPETLRRRTRRRDLSGQLIPAVLPLLVVQCGTPSPMNNRRIVRTPMKDRAMAGLCSNSDAYGVSLLAQTP